MLNQTKMKSTLSLLLTLNLVAVFLPAQDHGHLNIGAASTNHGAPLTWDNGEDFNASSGYVKTLEYTNAGKYAGYFQNNITLTALPQTAEYGGPVAGAASSGSLIFARMVLLSGPVGGKFGFWDTNSTVASGPSLSAAVGDVLTNLFRITQGSGASGVDPYGHIHGRRFSATKPGLYKVGFQAVDVSTNGHGGFPIHTSSTILPVWFQAGVNISDITRTNGVTTVTFGSMANRLCTVEYSTNLLETNWSRVQVLTGDDYFKRVGHTNAADGQSFYRVRTMLP